jgi:hypothetical protein
MKKILISSFVSAFSGTATGRDLVIARLKAIFNWLLPKYTRCKTCGHPYAEPESAPVCQDCNTW